MESTDCTIKDRIFNKELLQYYKNQSKPSDLSVPFTDSFFPPNENSLLAKDSNGNFIDEDEGPKYSKTIDVSQIEWKRASEIFPNFLVFEGAIDPTDIKQGKIGNCYFLSSIASLCEFPNLIYQIFLSKEVSKNGYYELVLFIDGRYQIVILDDYFPVVKGTNLIYFARPNKNELWVMLLEKAWAKVNGGYANIISGWPSEALLALTGFSTNKIVFDKNTIDDIWYEIKVADKSNSILCISSKNDPSCEEHGLIKNHSYTLIDTLEIDKDDKTYRLCKLFNPWGHKEWNGEWSDSSPMWGENEKKQLDEYNQRKKDEEIISSIKDDGAFWISVEDLYKYYQRVDICDAMYDGYVKYFKVTGDKTCVPNVFNFYLRRPRRVAISLIRKQWRFNRKQKENDYPASIVVMRYDPKDKSLTNLKGAFHSYEDIDIYRSFKTGYYIVWVYQRDPTDFYYLRISSPAKFKYAHIGYDYHFNLLEQAFISSIKVEKLKKIEESGEIFEDICNNYQKSGIGYRIVINKSKTHISKWTNDANGIQNMTVLPPYNKQKNFEFTVEPNESNIVLAMKNDTYGYYWLNLQSKMKVIEKEALPPMSLLKNHLIKKIKQTQFSVEKFVNLEIAQSDNEIEDYYDLVTLSLEAAQTKKTFETIDSTKIMLEELIKMDPEVMKKVTDLPNKEEDESTLVWAYCKKDNGIYMGQIKDIYRQGRGAYKFESDGSIWVGYWKKNMKHLKGAIYNNVGTKIFEGEYKDGLREGFGVMVFESGERYEGEYKKDKRCGKGTFIWDDGSKWVGTFEDNEMNGKGMFHDTDGESWEVEYQNGEMVE